MVEQPETTAPKEKHPIPWTGFIVWPFVLLLLYVLSVGPVVMMNDRGRISLNNTFVWNFYSPLDWAYEETLFHKPLGIYLHLWSKRFEKNGELTLPPGAVRFTTTNHTQGK